MTLLPQPLQGRDDRHAPAPEAVCTSCLGQVTVQRSSSFAGHTWVCAMAPGTEGLALDFRVPGPRAVTSCVLGPCSQSRRYPGRCSWLAGGGRCAPRPSRGRPRLPRSQRSPRPSAGMGPDQLCLEPRTKAALGASGTIQRWDSVVPCRVWAAVPRSEGGRTPRETEARPFPGLGTSALSFTPEPLPGGSSWEGGALCGLGSRAPSLRSGVRTRPSGCSVCSPGALTRDLRTELHPSSFSVLRAGH